jgi:hypothetical protein
VAEDDQSRPSNPKDVDDKTDACKVADRPLVAEFVVAAVRVIRLVEQPVDPAVNHMLMFRREGHVLVEGYIDPAQLVAAHRPWAASRS